MNGEISAAEDVTQEQPQFETRIHIVKLFMRRLLSSMVVVKT